MFSTSFEPDKGFFELTIVKKTIFITIVLFFVFLIYIMATSNLRYEKGFIGLNNLFNIFKFPLSIFAVSASFLAIFATHHRSMQTKKQIDLAYNQNIFNNYYKHKEEFDKYVKMKSNKHMPNALSMYNEIFVNSSKGDYDVDFSILEELLEKVIGYCIQSTKEEQLIKEELSSIYIDIQSIEDRLGLSYIKEPDIKINDLLKPIIFDSLGGHEVAIIKVLLKCMAITNVYIFADNFSMISKPHRNIITNFFSVEDYFFDGNELNGKKFMKIKINTFQLCCLNDELIPIRKSHHKV